MRLTEKHLRQLIGSWLLREKDEARIYNKVMQRATAGWDEASKIVDTRSEEEQRLKSLDPQALKTTYAHRDANKQRVANEKELKRIWAEEVALEGSRSFFDETLIKVHWVGGYKGGGAGSGNPVKIALDFIKSLPKGRVKDEISCFGYAPSQGIDHKPTPVGVIIKGYTTYASAQDAGTHMTSRATDAERRKHSGSGLHKRPLMLDPSRASNILVVDEESWDSVSRSYHEVIVDNWVVSGIIIPSFQGMIDEFKRKISGLGRERQGKVDVMVDEAKRGLQELGRLAAEMEIPFYDDKLQPLDFSGKEFEPGELESEWEKVISPAGDYVQGIATGDPEVPEIVVEGKMVNLKIDGFSKSITFKSCELTNVDFENIMGATVRIEDCEGLGAKFMSGEGSLELINPVKGKAGIVEIYQRFTIKSARFVGCTFNYEFMENLRGQREKNGSIITFENCKGLANDAESWSVPLDTSAKFYYYGPGVSEVKSLSADKIAGMMIKNPGGKHLVHVDGAWQPAESVKDVSDSYAKLLPPPPAPPPPPLSKPPVAESLLRQIIREDLLSEVDIGEVEGICMTRGSTHVMNTCYIGGDEFHLKFSSESAQFSENTDPSLQILVEWLAYKIYSLYPGIDLPGRIELVYDRENERVGIATSTVAGREGYSLGSEELAAGLSAGVYVDVFLANWDIGNTSNIIVRADDERPVRIDPGGALTFRAKGAKKGEAFSDYPGELESMLSGRGAAANIFRYSDLKVAARTFSRVPWELISAQLSNCNNEVRSKLEEYGLLGLLAQWEDEFKQISGKLKNRHREILHNVNFMKNMAQDLA